MIFFGISASLKVLSSGAAETATHENCPFLDDFPTTFSRSMHTSLSRRTLVLQNETSCAILSRGEEELLKEKYHNGFQTPKE
jgi:hypothetical protein